MATPTNRLVEDINRPTADAPESDPAETTDSNDPRRPTHRLQHIKVGERGVQLLVSTKDHVYDAENVDAGDDSVQCIGAMDDTSFGELAKMVRAHQSSVVPNARPAGADVARFHGGRVLGSSESENAPPRRG